MAEDKVYKILMVDDEPDVLEFMQYNLEKEGYEIQTANNGKECLEVAPDYNPDLIILDVMMPKMDGIETAQELRKNLKFEHTLIVFLTARDEDYSQIAGFEAGADDYVTKPIKPRVLISRLKALLRRGRGDDKVIAVMEAGDIKVDREQYAVFVKDERLKLPKKEFELLALLISKPGKVFTRDEIMDNVWGKEVIVGDRTIDVHLRKLREKLGEHYFKTIKGVGYKFEC